MRCLRHKVEGAIHSQGHVSDWPAQLPKTVLLVGIGVSCMEGENRPWWLLCLPFCLWVVFNFPTSPAW